MRSALLLIFSINCSLDFESAIGEIILQRIDFNSSLLSNPVSSERNKAKPVTDEAENKEKTDVRISERKVRTAGNEIQKIKSYGPSGIYGEILSWN